MNFIQQAYKGQPNFWKYLLPTLGLFGIFALNSIAIAILDLDMGEMMRQEILAKGSNRVFFESLIIFVIFLAGLFFWVRFVHRQPIKSLTTSRDKVDIKRIFFAFSLWAIITIVVVVYAYFTVPEDFIWNFNLNKFIILALLSIVLIPIQTSFEEYFFRGYLMQGLGVLVKNRWFPLIFTSVTFGLMHMANPEVEKLGLILMVYYIGTGLFLGIITLMDEGLELALGFHASNNLVTALLVTTDWTAFQTDSILRDVSEPSAGFDIIIPVFIFFPILTFIFSKKYGWKNWKEKLMGRVEEPTLIADEH
ncbi:CPBP family intramembrane glutamic endopeptidase [Aureibaculum conchae]|uniref:CPBP family intramembrane glutamic endopeptidase n=1 Tax=Aureibaculum sp. 2308TA14-22 TaxID=3108392 RepID=UPI003393EB86